MSVSRRRFLELGAGLTAASTLGCGPLERLFQPLWQKPEGPFLAPEGEGVDPVRHLLDRLTFGARPEDYGELLGLAPDPEQAIERWLERQLAPDSMDDRPVERLIRRLETLAQPAGELFEYKPNFLLKELTTGVVLRATYSRRQLFERMVHFWSDHFNVDSSKGDCKWLVTADDRDVIRRHALGSFPELLRAAALSPSMLWYLDGRKIGWIVGNPTRITPASSWSCTPWAWTGATASGT